METQQTMQQRVDQSINRLYADPYNENKVRAFVDTCMEYRGAYPEASKRFWLQVLQGWRLRSDVPKVLIEQCKILFVDTV